MLCLTKLHRKLADYAYYIADLCYLILSYTLTSVPASLHMCIVTMQPNASHDAALKRAYSPSLVCLVSARGGSNGGPLTATRAQIDEVAASSCKIIVSPTASCSHCSGEPVLICTACKEMFCAKHLKMTLECVLPCGCCR